MTDKKEITINKNLLSSILLSFILGFLILFIIEHFGNFEVQYSLTQKDRGDYTETYWTYGTKLTGITYKTPFGSKVETHGKGFTIGDFEYNREYSDFKYSDKMEFYRKGFTKDILYGFIFSIALLGIIYYIKNFKIKLK